MRVTNRAGVGCVMAILGIFLMASNGLGYEINDKFSIGGVIAGIGQYQSISDAPGFENEGRGLLLFEPEMSFTPTENDELFAKFGFGAGNGLDGEGRSPFLVPPWAGNVQDDYKDINGRNRDYSCLLPGTNTPSGSAKTIPWGSRAVSLTQRTIWMKTPLPMTSIPSS